MDVPRRTMSRMKMVVAFAVTIPLTVLVVSSVASWCDVEARTPAVVDTTNGSPSTTPTTPAVAPPQSVIFAEERDGNVDRVNYRPGSRVVFASDRDGNLEICSMSGGRLVAAAAHVQSATTPNRPGHPTSAASSL